MHAPCIPLASQPSVSHVCAPQVSHDYTIYAYPMYHMGIPCASHVCVPHVSHEYPMCITIWDSFANLTYGYHMINPYGSRCFGHMNLIWAPLVMVTRVMTTQNKWTKGSIPTKIIGTYKSEMPCKSAGNYVALHEFHSLLICNGVK